MKLLLSEEFDLDFASSGEAALVLLRDRVPDLVLSDVMMPGMDGQTLCRRIKADDRLRHIPVILVTARSGSEMLAEGMESGADDYVAKPFDSVELKARIRSLLRMRQAEAELALVNQNLKVRTTDLVDRQRVLFLSMIKSLVSALDAKDRYTRDHSTRVTEFTLRIAEKMGLNERELKDLELASILHDVGKIAVPEKILNKRGRLTEEEFAYIKEHPVVGENILKPIIELQQVANVVRHHHERYDGTGYPDRLKSLEIPIGSRIMAVADTYDSITSDRPYRNADSHNSAVKEILKSSGTQFDPEVVGFFLEVAKTFAAPEKPAVSNGAV
jgi:putative nucleotidyltransferase with HDIG domain